MEIQTALRPLADTAPFSNFPVLAELFRRLDELELIVRFCEAGIEIQPVNEVSGLPNRAHLRIVFPSETKCVLFFHKKSSIPFSRDRFSYGGLVIDVRSCLRFNQTDTEEWVQYLFGGLQPGSRPASLKKSLPYTIPED